MYVLDLVRDFVEPKCARAVVQMPVVPDNLAASNPPELLTLVPVEPNGSPERSPPFTPPTNHPSPLSQACARHSSGSLSSAEPQ